MSGVAAQRIVCPHCKAGLRLSTEEMLAHRFTCARCKKETELPGKIDRVACPHCGARLRLSDEELLAGGFECASCKKWSGRVAEADQGESTPEEAGHGLVECEFCRNLNKPDVTYCKHCGIKLRG